MKDTDVWIAIQRDNSQARSKFCPRFFFSFHHSPWILCKVVLLLCVGLHKDAGGDTGGECFISLCWVFRHTAWISCHLSLVYLFNSSSRDSSVSI